MSLRDRIKDLRKEKNIQQKELAYTLGISQSTVSHWESGRQEPNTGQRKKLANFFKITEADLFTEGPLIRDTQAVYESLPQIPVIMKVSGADINGLALEPVNPEENLKFKNCQAMKILTNDLAPILLKGQTIIYQEAELQNGDLVLVDLTNEAQHIKKYFNDPANQIITLHSIIPTDSSEPLIIKSNQIKSLTKIIAIMV